MQIVGAYGIPAVGIGKALARYWQGVGEFGVRSNVSILRAAYGRNAVGSYVGNAERMKSAMRTNEVGNAKRTLK